MENGVVDGGLEEPSITIVCHACSPLGVSLIRAHSDHQATCLAAGLRAVTWDTQLVQELREAVWVRSQTRHPATAYVRPVADGADHLSGGISMLVWLAVILLVAWLLGWGVFHVAGGLIHLLLVIALVVFLVNFISGRRTI
jgi:hypothetical protein